MEIKSLPIDRLNLSTRSYNALRRNGISTTSELALLSEEDIFAMKNLGQKSAQEILNKLNDFLLGKDDKSDKVNDAENTKIQPLSELSDETKTEIKDLNSGNKEKVTSVTIPVTLVAGNNVIRMGNNFGWAPDIDCFKLSKRQ